MWGYAGMTEAEQRALIVAEARSWLGTPYHNCADIKMVGVDCGMLIVRVFVDTGLCAPFDPRPYAPDWHLHRSAERYLAFILERCAEVEVPEIGDVMLFHYGRCYSHGGIVSGIDPLKIIHAFSPWRKVVDMDPRQDPELSNPKRKPKFYSFWKKRSDAEVSA